jgi:hypothetical protein
LSQQLLQYKENIIMLSTQTSEPEVIVPVQPRRPLTATLGRRLSPIVSLTLVLLFVAACAPGETPPDAICDTYNRALFTTQLMGGAAVLLGLAILGFRKNISAILPSQGAQVGAVAGSVFLGLILLAFSTDIGNQILLGFGIESLWVLCGLG